MTVYYPGPNVLETGPMTAATVATLGGPSADGVTLYVDEFDAVYRWHLGDATAADGYRVLSHTGGSEGRWWRIDPLAATVLTSAANHVAINAAAGASFTHTLSENTTLDNPTGLAVGQTFGVTLKQHASAAKTLAFGSYFKFGTLTPSMVSVAVGKYAELSCKVIAADYILCTWADGGGAGF